MEFVRRPLVMVLLSGTMALALQKFADTSQHMLHASGRIAAADGVHLRSKDTLLPRGVVERIDGPRDSRATNATAPVVVVVSHRELVIGCHDFDDYLSDEFETWFVFEESFVKGWKLNTWVQSSTRGFPHLLVTAIVPGETYARAAVLGILQDKGHDQGEPRLPEFLYYSHCDIHPLPQWHAAHTPFEKMVFSMIAEFQLEKSRRSQGAATTVEDIPHFRYGEFAKVNKSCFNDNPSGRQSFPILAMNTVMVESLPRQLSLEGATFHAVDVGGFVAQDGFSKAGKGAWLSDVTTWMEDHSIMFDVALYLEINDVLAQVGTALFWNDDFLAELMCKHDWIGVRNNAFFLFYDRAWPLSSVDESLASRAIRDWGKYDAVDLDYLKVHNLELLAKRDQPMARLREHTVAKAVLKVNPVRDWGNSFVSVNWHDDWLPRQLREPAENATIAALQGDLVPLFSMAGFEQITDIVNMENLVDALVLQRISVPLARNFVTSSEPMTLSEARLSRAEQPSSCLQCSSFLKLWEPTSNRRIVVWATNYGSNGTTIADAYLEGSSRLNIPVASVVLSVSSPIARDAVSFSAFRDEFAHAAQWLCRRKMAPALGATTDQSSTFLPAEQDMFYTRFANLIEPAEQGALQGIPCDGYADVPARD